MGLFDKLRQAESNGDSAPQGLPEETPAEDLGPHRADHEPSGPDEGSGTVIGGSSARADLTKAMERGRETALHDVAVALGGALAHLAVQTALAQSPGSQLTAADIGQTAGRLLTQLDAMGISTVGQPGEADQFDPNWHVPLRTDDRYGEGDAIIIRTPAVVAPSGRVVRKAGVDRV